MGDEEPATKADLNSLMTRMEAMMVVIESQKTQLDVLTSGTSSTTPPTLEGLIFCYRWREIAAIIATESSLAWGEHLYHPQHQHHLHLEILRQGLVRLAHEGHGATRMPMLAL
jgi:hypothetical protein